MNGELSNQTGETLLVYGPRLPGETFDNSLYYLPFGKRTPPGWDCDGFFLPIDRIADQALSNIPGPAAIKYRNYRSPIIETSGPERYRCPLNEGAYRSGEIHWSIPNLRYSDLPGSFPEVPSPQLWLDPESLLRPEPPITSAAYSLLLETQCGAQDDSQDVEEYDGSLGPSKQFVEAMQGQVCQFQWKSDLAQRYSKPGSVSGARWGTGTLIAENIVITCGHLFDPEPFGWQVPRVNGENNRLSPQEIATNMIVNFNYQYRPDGSLREVESFDVVELIEYRLAGLDMAICRVDGSPGRTYGTSKLSAINVKEGDLLAIIGHPAGFPKRIEAGPVSSIDEHKIFYSDIDTLGGNSGSGILRAADSALIGIHTNGGCREDGAGSNSGFKATSIIASSPFLQNLLR